jgi:hypothetical protein
MDKKSLSERDICTKFITPALVNAGWDTHLQVLEEVLLTGRNFYPELAQKLIGGELEKQLAKTKQVKEHIIANQQATEQLLKVLLYQAFEVQEKEYKIPEPVLSMVAEDGVEWE